MIRRIADGRRHDGLSPADLRIPPVTNGLRIGLFGGSFNPPHEGHVHVVDVALSRLALDRVWVMVTPGNPLKDHGELRPLRERLSAVRGVLGRPRVEITALELAIGSPYSWVTVDHLTVTRPNARFVWLMGADNLAGFHRWQHWRRIVHALPIAVVDRPGATLSPLSAPMALSFAAARLPERDAAELADRRTPAWTFVHAPRVSVSSTELRGKPRAR